MQQVSQSLLTQPSVRPQASTSAGSGACSCYHQVTCNSGVPNACEVCRHSGIALNECPTLSVGQSLHQFRLEILGRDLRIEIALVSES